MKIDKNTLSKMYGLEQEVTDLKNGYLLINSREDMLPRVFKLMKKDKFPICVRMDGKLIEIAKTTSNPLDWKILLATASDVVLIYKDGNHKITSALEVLDIFERSENNAIK